MQGLQFGNDSGYHLSMTPANRTDFIWLLSDQAAPILASVQAGFGDRESPVKIAKSLRKQISASRSALVMEQAQLRIAAEKKFSLAAEMFFTRRGLEQASGSDLADYKSSKFRKLASVADVCCGVGGDLLAMARRSDSSSIQTIGVDKDELTCLFARRNLEVNALTADVRQLDCEAFEIGQLDGLHIDPDRRTTERTVQGNRFSPPLDWVFAELPDRCSASIKVAPATPWADYFPDSIEREWIGDHRECKQQVLWSGPATTNPGHRTATYVGKNRCLSQISVPESELDRTSEFTDSIHQFVFEPHPTVLAAGLTDALAHQHSVKRFSAGIGYLTGDQPIDDPLLRQFQVLCTLPLNLRKTVQALKQLDVGSVEVKKRGIETVTADLFKRMKLSGPNRATVILTRIGKQRVSIIAQR